MRAVSYTHLDTTFGSEIEEQLIGQPMNDEVTQMELERYTTEALMCNPYIEELSEFDFVLQKDGIKESFRCRSVYGEETDVYKRQPEGRAVCSGPGEAPEGKDG